LDEQRIALAESALSTAGAVIALHRAGQSRPKIASALDLTEAGVWRIQYAFGLADNTDEALKRDPRPSWMRVSAAAQSKRRKGGG
jgi:hypothetical protein